MTRKQSEKTWSESCGEQFADHILGTITPGTIKTYRAVLAGKLLDGERDYAMSTILAGRAEVIQRCLDEDRIHLTTAGNEIALAFGPVG